MFKKNSNSSYLIEDKVEFSPTANALRSLSDDAHFTLLAASSECFLYLLKNHGKLVSKAELMHAGWEQYGLHVSDNTFYQNILVLRKGLKLCGIENEVIKTITRKGLMIPESVKVSINHESNLISDESVDFLQPQKERSEVEVKEEVKEEVKVKEREDVREAEVGHESLTKFNKKVTWGNSFILLLVLLSTVGFGMGIYYTKPDNYLSKYKYIDIINGCRVNLDAGNFNEKEFRDFITEKEINCSNNEELYFTTYKYIPRVSVIECKYNLNEMAGVNDCISYYFLDKNSDQ